ncbi:hypothetical protein, partial [Campylobacter majalis]|uniref:hypothetical protein n=1 Tax=Campylobacter majalis TaxID=2790656 RepID=UPI001E45F3CB
IEDEYNKATAITKATHLIATVQNAKVSGFFDYVGLLYNGYNKDKISLDINLDVLNNPNANIFEKQQAAQNIAAQAGLSVKFANLEPYSGGKFNQDDPSSVYIDTKSLASVETFLTALRHEQAHYLDNKNGIFIPKDKEQNEFATAIALKQLDMSIKALDINDKRPSDYKPNIDKNNPIIINNTNYLYSLDQSKSDDLIWAPIVAIAGLSSYLNAPDVNEQPKNGVVIDN